MNDSKSSVMGSRKIQLAWFSAASARYLDLGLTATQRLCVFLECRQVAMSHGDFDLSSFCYEMVKDFQQKENEVNNYMRLARSCSMKKEYDNAILYSKKCLVIAQECGIKVAEMNAYYTLVDAHLQKEEYDDAISYSKKCLGIAQECVHKVAEMNAYLTLGDIHLKKEEYDDAISYSKKFLDIKKESSDKEVETNAQECGNKVAEMNAYYMLGIAHLKKEEYDDAISYSKECLDIARECGIKVSEMNAYNTLGIAHLDKEEYDDGILYSEKCLEIAQECGDKVAEMNAYYALGAAHLSKAEYDDAILYSKKCLDIAQKCDNKMTFEINAYYTLGAAHLSKGEYDDAISYSKKCLDIAHECGDKVAQRDAYYTLGKAHLKKEEYDDAISYSKKCLDIAQECSVKEVEMNAYLTLGAAYLNKKEYDDAILYGKKCLDVAHECGNEVAQRDAYNTLGAAHLRKEEYDDAISYSKKCLDIKKESSDKEVETNAYLTLGVAYLNKKGYDDAILYGKKCLDVVQQCGEVVEMNAYRILGDAYLKKKENDNSISYSKKYLDIAQQCGDEVAEMNAYFNLGNAYFNKKEFDYALLYSKKCLDIAQACGIKEAEMNAYYILGGVHLPKEQDDAILYSEKCIAIAQECGDKEIEMYAYLILGASYLSKQEYDLSYTYLTNAMEIVKDSPNDEVVINVKLLLENLYHDIGLAERLWTEDEFREKIRPYVDSCIYIDKQQSVFMPYYEEFLHHISRQEYQEAAFCLKQALAIVAAHDDCLSPHLLSYQYKISEMYRSLGQYDNAKQYYQKTLNLAVETENYKFQGNCHFGLAKMFYDLEQFKNSEKSCKESMECFENVFDNLGRNDQFKIAFVDKYRDTYKLLLKLLIQANKKEEALVLSERYRARALKDLLISSYGMKTEETGKEILQYTDVQTLVSSSNYTLLFYSTCFGDLHSFLIGGNKLEFTVQHFKYCETCLDKIVDKAFDEMQVREVVSCEDRSSEAMDDIEEDKNPNPEEEELRQLLSRVKEKLLSEQCRTTCDCRRDPSENSDESSTTSSLGILYHKLIHNLMCSINQDEIVIIPEGPLNKVPFAALRDPETGQYLSETKRIRLAPSMTTLRLIQDCPVNHYSDTGALIIGDPLVGRVMMNGVEREFERLYGAFEEAADIALILEVPPLLASEATKPKVIEKLIKGVSVVHIAAHGSLDKATILLAPSEETRAKKVPEEEDYMLTMADVQQAQVRAQLVVLSCCHSGRGEIKAEGVVGMCRAFLASGARAVVASLWAIDDEATLVFMRMLYTYLKDGESASTSLHLTMKYMREKTKYNEPKYWAPFFLMGDDVTIELK